MRFSDFGKKGKGKSSIQAKYEYIQNNPIVGKQFYKFVFDGAKEFDSDDYDHIKKTVRYIFTDKLKDIINSEHLLVFAKEIDKQLKNINFTLSDFDSNKGKLTDIQKKKLNEAITKANLPVKAN